MNKPEFVAAMSRHGAMSKADAGDVLQVFSAYSENRHPGKESHQVQTRQRIGG